MFEEGARLKREHGPENVFDFSLGNPDLPPPEAFRKALEEAAADTGPGVHGYMANNGYQRTREAVAAQVGREQGCELAPDDIVMTCGAAGGLNTVLKAVLNPGDAVVVIAPFFVEYGFYVENHGGRLVTVDSGPGFRLDPDAVARAVNRRTRAVIINSPNNPTGRVYGEDELSGLARVLDGKDLLLIADEPYRKIVFDGTRVPSIMRFFPESVVITSYSKDLSLAGERIGHIAVSPRMADREEFVAALVMANRILGFVNAPALMQRAVERVQGASVDVSVYQRRRDLFCRILAEAGYSFTVPQGAFYLFPESPVPDDAGFVGVLARERILAVPGRGFGRPGFFRLAFCVPDQVIEAAAEGFRRALQAVA
jgi:aspartate aminotransferase